MLDAFDAVNMQRVTLPVRCFGPSTRTHCFFPTFYRVGRGFSTANRLPPVWLHPTRAEDPREQRPPSQQRLPSQDQSPAGSQLAEALTTALLGHGFVPSVPSSWFCLAQAPSESIAEPPTTPTTPLQDIISNMLLSCDEDEVAHMQEQYTNVQQLCEDSCSDAGLGVSTACSGTDLFIPVFRTFFREFSFLFGRRQATKLGVDHLRSCEHIPWKSKWIRKVMGCSTMFTDVKDLSKSKAPAFDGTTKPVFRGFAHAEGFSCLSVSALHANAKRFKRCIQHRAGSTGSTFWFSFLHAKRHRPFLLLLENVSRLGKHNVRIIRRLLRALGYVVIVLSLSSVAHGISGRRVRIWIIAVLAPIQSLSDVTCERLQEYAESLDCRVRQAALPLDRLLDDIPDEPRGEKRKAPARVPAQRRGSSSRKKPRIPKWQALHKKVWEQYELKTSTKRPRELPPHLQYLETSRLATAREVDVAFMDFIKNHSKYMPGMPRRIIDFSQGILRAPVGSGDCPTLTPGSRAHLINQDCPRALRGLERLRLQRFSLDMTCSGGEAKPKHFTERQLSDLAGNAFCANHVSIALLVAMTLFKMPRSLD